MPKADWESRKTDQRTAQNADQAEFLAMKLGACPLEEGVRDDRTADAMDDFGALDTRNTESWAVDDGKVDDAVGAIASEIERRAEVMQLAYPFIKTGNTLSYRPSHTLAYELCLAIVNAPNVTSRAYIPLQIAFERLCRDVVKNFLGASSQAIRTGMPLDDHDQRTTQFKSVVDTIHGMTGEWRWNPGPGRPQDPSYQDSKDMGIDFAVWKRVSDGRRGMLFVLGQCACGDDWTDKFKDLDIDQIERDWFQYFSVARPLRVFCVPRHIPNATYFDEVNQKAGLAFDRARLAIIAEEESHRAAIIAGAAKPLTELANLVIGGLGVVARAPSPPQQRVAVAQRFQSRGHVARPSQP